MPSSTSLRVAARSALAASVAFVGVTLPAAPAQAFCRSTTCTGDCPRDENECKSTGKPLYWPGMCIGFSLQRDGTEHIPMSVVVPVIQASFAEWSERECGSGLSTLGFVQLNDVACHRTEYSEDHPNANLVLFQDTKWTYKGIDNTLAKTTVTFDSETGEIFDADIEINHAYNEFTVTDVEADVKFDLQSVVTHEVGHLIGLDHTQDYDATMFASYDEGATALRTIEQDDIDAACAVYPPERDVVCDPEPRQGLGLECAPAAETAEAEAADEGCSVARAGGSSQGRGGVPAALGVLALTLELVRRRSRRS